MLLLQTKGLPKRTFGKPFVCNKRKAKLCTKKSWLLERLKRSCFAYQTVFGIAKLCTNVIVQ